MWCVCAKNGKSWLTGDKVSAMIKLANFFDSSMKVTKRTLTTAMPLWQHQRLGVCGWQKWLRFGFRLGFAKKLEFSVRFRFTKINRGFGFFASVRPTFVCRRRRHLSFTPLRYDARNDVLPWWTGPTNYQRSDLELEVQRYGMKNNTVTVDPIMLEDELWMRQRENRTETAEVGFWKLNRRNRVFDFAFWGRFSSVFRKPISGIVIGFRTPLAMGTTRAAANE